MGQSVLDSSFDLKAPSNDSAHSSLLVRKEGVGNPSFGEKSLCTTVLIKDVWSKAEEPEERIMLPFSTRGETRTAGTRTPRRSKEKGTAVSVELRPSGFGQGGGGT